MVSNIVSLLVEEAVAPLPPCQERVGIDAGLTHLVVLSNGEKIANPRHERRDRRKLTKAQRVLSRTSKGSKNRAKARLEYKTSWYGRQLLEVDRFFPSSKLCSTPGCGYQNIAMALNIRTWTCPACGTVHDRDVNAARNILAVGLAER
jgi:putative transposase